MIFLFIMVLYNQIGHRDIADRNVSFKKGGQMSVLELGEDEKFAIANKILDHHIRTTEFSIANLKESLLNLEGVMKKLGSDVSPDEFRALAEKRYTRIFNEVFAKKVFEEPAYVQAENRLVYKLVRHRLMNERLNLKKNDFVRDLNNLAQKIGVESEKLKAFVFPIYQDALEQNFA